MLQYKTIDPGTLQLLKELQSLPLLQETRDPVPGDGVTLAGIKDIAAMKIAAIVGRGTKKDFIDMHFLLKRFSLQEILDLYMQKYPDGSIFSAMKSLSYFKDAEPDPMPLMFEEVSWETVKQSIRDAVSGLSKPV